MKKTFLILIGIIMLFACQNSNDSRVTTGDSDISISKIYKSDGSIQCESNGISLETMKQGLVSANITVHCSQKGNDGLVRASVCGNSTGKINIYLINTNDISKSNDLEFQSIEELSEYQDTPCE